MSLGLWRSDNSVEDRKRSLFSMTEIIPHVWVMLMQLAIVFFYANVEINSRVASTCPMYYWGLASLLHEGASPLSGSKTTAWFGKLAVFQNLIYMGINMVRFPLSAGFI